VEALFENPLLLYIPLFAAFVYFALYRPQKKQQQDKQTLMESMKKGDRVVTAGGIYGIIRGLKDDRVTLEIASEVFVSFTKSSIVTILSKEAKAAAAAPEPEVLMDEDSVDYDSDDDYVIEQDTED